MWLASIPSPMIRQDRRVDQVFQILILKQADWSLYGSADFVEGPDPKLDLELGWLINYMNKHIFWRL